MGRAHLAVVACSLLLGLSCGTPSRQLQAADVFVDLVPCILSDAELSESTAGSYVMDQFFQGYWFPKTEVFVVGTSDDLTALMVGTTGTTMHGKCNAVYVGIQPSAAQITDLTDYSAQFKVRIVYFWESLTSSDATYWQPKLGTGTYYAEGLNTPSYIQLTSAGSSLVSITQSDLKTDPTINNLTPVPVREVVAMSEVAIIAEIVGKTYKHIDFYRGQVAAVLAHKQTDTTVHHNNTIRIARYLDSTGTSIVTETSVANAAVLTYTGSDGHEEMHVFFPIAWFDTGSWAWAHYFNEWATKGVFMGERRFYLGAVVDDLFLSTPEFEYGNGADHESSTAYRCSGQDLDDLKSVQDSLNAQYPGSEIITEFAMNGAGILEQIGASYVPDYEETDVTTKGTKWYEDGQSTVHDINWLADNVDTMKAEFAAGTWTSGDDLLAAVISYLGDSSSFFHQSHTLIHLSRDQLRQSDCFTEDTGNVQIALLTGIWNSTNYNWRSMVSPGITGLFNEYCLESGDQNLMTCYPGDNTYDGVSTAISLVNTDTPFHSIYTTVATNGYADMQIIPRYATYVYYNCYTGDCLVQENEYIRRVVCGCANLDPSNSDTGTCTDTSDQCTGDNGIQSFGSIEAIFDAEASTTTRYLLTGRRDKYMFHQANIIPSSDMSGQSLLEYWYERVLQDYSEFITFPVKSVKFDDLCTNFKHHEDLDDSGGYVTMTVQDDGTVSGMVYNAGSGAGLMPLTVPTASASSYPTSSLTVYSTETYGTDTTYYLADSASLVPTAATMPDSSLLAAVPAAV